MTARDVFYAVLSGLMLASLFPPFRFDALAWAALVPLLWSLHGKRPHEGFALGLLTGLVAYGIIVWWVKLTMVKYGGLHPALAWLITLLLVAYLGLYTAVFAFGLLRMCPGGELSMFLLAAPLWVALELLRAHLLSGFPWALLGYSQYEALPVIQIADLTGVYGVSFLIVLVNAAVWHFFRNPHRAPFAVVGGTILALVLALGYGYLRLHEVPRDAGAPSWPVGIVQGNTEQAVKWSPAWQEAIMAELGQLTGAVARELREKPRPVPPLIVWPEAAAPFIYAEQPRWRQRMRETARGTGAYVLFGSLGVDRNGERPRLLNSAYLIGPEGRELGRYDKMHLVPFGEYVPFARFLFFVKKLVPVIGAFAEGEQAVVFDAPGGRFGVLICFEVIFPHVARRLRDAQFLVNITNDAWFGRSAASEQHLSMVALRAVELRVPVVRAANTGISALIDARGRIS
ncbi:MAG: apolipoprotein N-acyltransferase, partial [Candidatus Tectomicrobia bacterium]|nr:apolipoprotein N-acyltransferase [Candidatus Tectomicrobia bacterium]